MINTQPLPVDIHVVYACDHGFLQYLAVSIKSLVDAFETGSHRNTHRLNVHVVNVGFSDDDRALLKRIARSEIAQVKLALIDYALTNRYPDALYPHIELVTLKYRFPELLANIDRVIWIDADTLVLSDITELWDVDLDGHWIGTTNCVLTDASLKIYQITSRGFFWSAENTINAGVMVLDLMQMRTLNVQRVLEAWTYKFRKVLSLPEQEAIAFNYPVRKILDHKWNWRGALRESEPYWAAGSARERKDYSDIRPAIVHLQADFRPHNMIINTEFFSLWNRIHQALDLPPTQPKPVPFVVFVYLMACGSNISLRKARRLFVMAVINLPFGLWCLLPYRRYRRDPEKFNFPGISDPQRTSAEAITERRTPRAENGFVDLASKRRV